MRGFAVWSVVLNHREATDTLRCLDALGKVRYHPLTRLVVDNASGPGEVAWLRSAGATVVESGGNLGYAGGNNAGIRLALEAGAASPRIQSDGGRVVWEAGGRSELIGRGTAPGRGGEMRLVDFVPGAAMLVRRKVFEEVGLLPEEYFLYFEETDFCVRAARAGWKVAVDTRARVVHRFAAPDGLPAETLIYYFVRNRLLFGRRFTEVPFEALLADLDGFIASWRRRVQERKPEWLGRFEELVALAVADARSGVTGWRAGVGAG
jgi:GT2 family glycosyltransferase